MDEDDAWDALEELWEEGKVEHVPGIGDVDEHRFTLTENGVEDAEQLLREDDDQVLWLFGFHLDRNVERKNNKDEMLDEIVSFAKTLRDTAGVNLFRVLARNPDVYEWIDADGLANDFIEAFDP